MSAKQQLAEIVASLPESGSLEEAFERLYLAFKEKQRREAAASVEERLRRMAGATAFLSGPPPSEESLRRENLYEDRV